jgi:amino acid adenylation domain-containing protein
MTSNLARRIDELSPAKRRLLEAKLKAKAGARDAAPPIPRRAARESAPLSYGQQSLWFFDHLSPQTSLYNIPEVVRLSGPLDVAALRRALDALVARHEILRTTFADVGGSPVQAVGENCEMEFTLIDVSGCAEAGREAEAERRLNEQARRPFDLKRGPVVRAALVRRGPQDHTLLVSLHHIVSDGWSSAIIFQELTALYEAFAAGGEPALAELPIQYADYAAWQRGRLQGADFERELEYWRRQLSGAPAVLELPSDRPRPAAQSFKGGQVIRRLPKRLAEDLQALGRREGATLFMTLLAAFYALLARHSGQEDLVVGSPIAGRTSVETEGLIGFFVNTLALRGDVSGDPSFLELLGRVREAALGAFAHQEMPIEVLVKELHPERSLSFNPLFQAMFVLQNTPSLPRRMGELDVTVGKATGVTAKCDLSLEMIEEADGLRATLEYSADLFDAATAERMLGHFETLLAGVAADPSRRVSELPLLTPAERHQLLTSWNETETEYPKDAALHQLFEVQAGRTPGAVAVAFGGEELTYRELNARANRLAHYLKKQGVGAESLVAVYAERSAELIVATLAVLKAGGAYLPLDLSYPKDRLAFMLEDAAAPVLLTEKHLVGNLPPHAARLVCLDADRPAIERESDENPACVVTGANLAYVIYTSGSTGVPKGVAVEQRAVTRLVRDTNYIRLDASDRVAQVSNASFDAATFEIWGALLNGGRLVGIAKDTALSPSLFVEEIRAQGVTAMFLTTALFNQIVREIPDAFRTVKHLLFGGEACDPQAIRIALEGGAPRNLLHVYGPTESTTFATWHRVERVEEGATTVPIGRPLSNTQIYILDQNLHPVPVGVHGELYIGGDGLARGYLNRPELTAEKFVSVRGSGFGVRSSELSAPNAERLYKTGDLARFLPDGSVEFVGRVDHQVKIRGFRIELGEIEAHLAAHPDVRECAVAVREDRPGDKRIAAYFVADEGCEPSAAELRAALAEKLPDYMLPSAFVRMDALPLTPNGKVDRRRLPAPNEARLDAGEDPAAPQDELEVKLVRLWGQVLGVGQVGLRDNFFDLGGHSLLAVRLFAEVEKVFGQRLPLATLFQAPTVERFAAVLREQGWRPSWSSLVAIQPHGSRPPFFCVHAVGGNVLEYRALAAHLGEDQPFYALQSRGLDGKSAPLRSVEEMAAHYVKEIRELQPTGPYHLGGRSFGGNVAFEMARQLRAAGEEVALVAVMDSSPLGWMELLAPDEARRLRREFRAKRVARHLENVRGLKLSEQVAYVRGKAEFKKRRLRHLAWRLKYRLRGERPPTLAEAIRDVEEFNYIAACDYRPQPAAGRVTLFWASEEVNAEKTRRGWGVLAAGGVEMREVRSNHLNMIEEPYVGDLAAQLKDCLERARRSGDLGCRAPRESGREVWPLPSAQAEMILGAAGG